MGVEEAAVAPQRGEPLTQGRSSVVSEDNELDGMHEHVATSVFLFSTFGTLTS